MDMSISTISSTITRTQKEIADLHHKISVETKKESDCGNRIGQIERSITKNISITTLNSKNSEVQRKQNEIAKIQVKKANLHKKLADKDGRLLKLKQDLQKEEEKERKKQATTDERERKRLAAVEKKSQNDQLNFQRSLRREIEITKQASTKSQNSFQEHRFNQAKYDLFISHASDDKEELVRPLVEELEKLNIKVWYDEFTLKVGDSLRKSIDHGLANSKYGTVVLSSSFFSKNWPQYELDGMVAKEMHGHKMILPIWHKVSKNEVIGFSPTLADKVALNSSINSIEEIAKQLAEVING